jgi:glycine cleavage system H protein
MERRNEQVYPQELRYNEWHEWIRVDGSVVTVGISHYAQDQMGDLVYVEVPEVGRRVAAGEPFASIESVKAVQDLNAPVSGAVVEANTALSDVPETVNRDCYGEGWLVKIEIEDASELANLWDAERYEGFLKTL